MIPLKVFNLNHMRSINRITKLISFFCVLMFLQLNLVIASVHSEPSDLPNIVVIRSFIIVVAAGLHVLLYFQAIMPSR